MQRQQMAQRIDRRMNLRSLAPLGSVVAGPRSRLRRRSQRTAVDTHRRRLAFATAEMPQQFLHIGHQNLEDPGFHPAPHLLVHRRPRR
jgi:hypothetical protein